MIRKIYSNLSDLCTKELHPRGFILQEFSSLFYHCTPNLDSQGKIWTKERTVSSQELRYAFETMQCASGNSSGIKFQLEGRVSPEKLGPDWKDLEVRVFKMNEKQFALVAPDALYANRALISKITRREAYPAGEKPPFPVHDCKVMLLENGILGDTMPVMSYSGALDIHSYKQLLSLHGAKPGKENVEVINVVRKIIQFYASRFGVILDGFTRREQYSLGLDPLRAVKE